MKKFQLAVLALVITASLFSCKKDDTNGGGTATPVYVGKWNYVSREDTFYNWAELIYNNNVQQDSTKTLSYAGMGYYYEFNADNSFNRNSSAGLETGTYFFDTISDPKTMNLMFSTRTDTITYDLTRLDATNMNYNVLFGALNGNGDTVVVDRYYYLSKN